MAQLEDLRFLLWKSIVHFYLIYIGLDTSKMLKTEGRGSAKKILEIEYKFEEEWQERAAV